MLSAAKRSRHEQAGADEAIARQQVKVSVLMRQRLRIYLTCACAVLVHSFAIAGAADAQDTDRRVLIGIGIAPLSVTSTKSTTDLASDRSTTVTQASLGGKVLLSGGLGLGPWVLALEAAFSHSVAREEQDESSFDGTDAFVTKRSEITLGPSGRFLFIEGMVRPYVEIGAGFGLLLEDAEGAMEDGTTLYVRGGPGVQLRLTDAASIDLALRAGYAATSGEIEMYLLGGRYNAMTGLYEQTYPASSVEYDIHEITADIAARLSIWL